jgi:hypothetical protein
MEVISAVAKKRAQVLDVGSLPALTWPPGLGTQNGQLGYVAGMGLLSDLGVAEPSRQTTAELFAALRFPTVSQFTRDEVTPGYSTARSIAWGEDSGSVDVYAVRPTRQRHDFIA